MYLLRLIIKKYKIIDYADITFDPKGVYLIVGENQDGLACADSNGAGKTSFMDAIYWCLFGSSLEKCKADAVIPFGEDTASVSLVMMNNGKMAKIDRTRSRTSQEVTFTEFDANGNGTTLRDTPTKLKANIFNYLFPNRSMSSKTDGSNLFSRIIYLSGNRLEAFSSGDYGPTEKMNILNSIIDNNSIAELAEIEKTFKEKKSEVKAKLEVLSEYVLEEVKLAVILGEIENGKTELESITKRSTQINKEIETKTEARTSLSAQLSEFQHLNKDLSSALLRAERQQKNIREKITECKIFNARAASKTETLVDNIAKLNASTASTNALIELFQETKLKFLICTKDEELQQLLSEQHKIQVDLHNLENIKSKLLYCPVCNSSLAADGNKLIKADDEESIARAIATLKTALQELKNKIILYRTDLDSFKVYNSQLALIKEYETKKIKCEFELNQINWQDATELETQYAKVQIDIDNIRAEITNITNQQELTELSRISKELDNLHKEYQDLLLTKTAKELTKQKDEQKLDAHYEYNEKYVAGAKVLKIVEDWIQLVKMYRQERLNQLLSNFEFEADKIFNEFSLGNLRFEFNGLGENSAEFRIQSKLAEDPEFRDIETLSSGEVRRCGLSIAFAARQIIAQGDHIKVCLFDEALDKLDNFGRAKLVEYLKNAESQIFIVSHTPDVASLFDSKIAVVRSQGRSKVELR